MRKSLYVCGAIAYVAISVWDIGCLNATFRAESHRLEQDKYQARDDFAASVIFGVLPPFIFLTPLFTGFYAEGWTLESKPFPCTDEYQDIWCRGNQSNSLPQKE